MILDEDELRLSKRAKKKWEEEYGGGMFLRFFDMHFFDIPAKNRFRPPPLQPNLWHRTSHPWHKVKEETERRPLVPVWLYSRQDFERRNSELKKNLRFFQFF